MVLLDLEKSIDWNYDDREFIMSHSYTREYAIQGVCRVTQKKYQAIEIEEGDGYSEIEEIEEL